MSLPALQSDSVAGTAHWLNHQFVHVSGASDGTADGAWSYGSASHEITQSISYRFSDKTWIDGNATSIPDAVTLSGSDSSSTSAQNSQYVFLWNTSTQFLGKFQNPFYDSTWTPGSGSGSGTLGSTFQTANFNGTTVQQIKWTVINGTSPTPNANYYLFNESPGGTAKGTINLGSNPQAGASTLSTYQDPSGADFTGKWYVGYGQNATRVNLAVYNFARKKVHSNFW